MCTFVISSKIQYTQGMYTLNCRGKIIELRRPLVMGIINVTPDSFYAGSQVPGIDEALRQASAMIEDGADILDIGGQSTRPGSGRLSTEEESARVVPVI